MLAFAVRTQKQRPKTQYIRGKRQNGANWNNGQHLQQRQYVSSSTAGSFVPGNQQKAASTNTESGPELNLAGSSYVQAERRGIRNPASNGVDTQIVTTTQHLQRNVNVVSKSPLKTRKRVAVKQNVEGRESNSMKFLI